MAKTYRIILQIQSQAAEAAAQRAEQRLHGVERAALRAAQATERATNQANAKAITSKTQTTSRLQAIEDRYLMREYQGRVAHARRAQETAERSADQLQSVQDRLYLKDQKQRASYEAKKQQAAERSAQKLTEQKQREADQLQSIQDRLFLKDQKQRASYEARKQQAAERSGQRAIDQQQREAERLQSIQDKLFLKEYRQRVSHERRKELLEQRESERSVTLRQRQAEQLQKVEDHWLQREYRERVAYQQKIQHAEEEAVEQRTALISRGSLVAFYAAAKAAGYYIEALDQIRERASAAAEATLKMRDALRVEAALKGEPRANDKVLAQAIQFRAQTGLGEAEASDFTRQYLGSLPIAFEKKNITQDVADKLQVQAGIMAARQGGDAGTRGELAGLLGQFGKVKSVEHGVAQLEGIRQALVAGRGDDTPLTRQLLKISGEMVGEGEKVPSITEAAALIGTTSLSAGPGAAGTRVRRINRFLTETKGKGAAFLKKIGIKESDTLEERLDKLYPVLQKAKAEGRDLTAFLSESVGGGNQAEIEAVREITNIYQPFKERMAMARKAEANGGDILKQNEEFKRSTQGRAHIGEALKDAAKVSRGLRAERYEAILGEAEASPEFQAEEGSAMTSMKDRLLGIASGHFTDSVEFGRRTRLEGHAERILKRRAAAAGVTDEDLTKARHESYKEASENGTDIFQEFVNKVESLIAQRGGTNEAETAPAMDRLTKSIDNLAKLMEQGQQRQPAPLPGPPRAGPVRGG